MIVHPLAGASPNRRLLRPGNRALQPAAVVAVAVLALGGPAAVAAPSAASAAAPAHAARPSAPGHYREFASGRVLVRFRDGTSVADQRRAATAAGARLVKHVGVGAQVLAVAAGGEERAVTALRADARVRYAEPDYLSVPTGTPDDPRLADLWALQNTGQTVNGITGTAGADANVVPAWDVTTGSPDVVVAEVDTGVEYTHPDLDANVWKNPGGIGGCSAGTRGYNVLNQTCDPMDDDTSYGGHGTHVAGIIGATGNNGTGVVGMSWDTTILPVKWIASDGAGANSDLVAALDWVIRAKRAGVDVKVVNDSNVFVGTAYSQALADEIDALAANDILFVTAAGSTGGDNDNPAERRYPCSYARTNEICATWSDQHDTLSGTASFGSPNVGATSVDLAAPGNNILSTLRNGGYGYLSGGSMSAAAVSGAAALVLSAQDMTARDLKADLLEHAEPLAALTTTTRTGGRLDVCAAVPGCGAVAPPTRPFAVTPPAVAVSQTQPDHPSPEPQQGSVLTAGQGDWDGAPKTFAYSWDRCSSAGHDCVATGTTGPSYTVGAADVGQTLQVAVTASGASGTTVSRSVPTLVVQPAAPARTFGKTAVGANADPADDGWQRANSYALAEDGQLTKLTVYLARRTSGSQSLRGVVYADDGGSPGALRGVTSDLTVDASATSGWYDLTFPAPVSLPAGRYWLGIQAGPTSDVFSLRYDESTPASSAVLQQPYVDGPYTGGPPWARADAEQFSLYGTLSADTTAPVVTITAAPPALTRSLTALFSFAGSDPGRPSARLGFGCALDTGPWADCTSPRSLRGLAQGLHTFRVRAVDEADNASPVVSRTWRVDSVAPTLKTAATPVFTLGSAVGLRYSGTDGGSGIGSYDVRYRRAPFNGTFGGYVTPAGRPDWAAVTGTAVALPAARGYTYCLSARARDKAGNVSGWSAERCTSAVLDDRSLYASTGWTRGTGSGYYAGTITSTSRLGAYLTRPGVQARRLSLVATRCSGCGTVGVYWNGSLIRTISLSGSTTAQRQLYAVADFGHPRTGTVTIKALNRGVTRIDGLGISRS